MKTTETLLVFALGIAAVVYAPITGFWWNLFIFIGANSCASFALGVINDISTPKDSK